MHRKNEGNKREGKKDLTEFEPPKISRRKMLYDGTKFSALGYCMRRGGEDSTQMARGRESLCRVLSGRTRTPGLEMLRFRDP